MRADRQRKDSRRVHGAINRLVIEAERGALEDEVWVLYVSPLKALANDIRLNFEEPLEGAASVARETGIKIAGYPRWTAHRRHARQ